MNQRNWHFIFCIRVSESQIPTDIESDVVESDAAESDTIESDTIESYVV